MTAFRLDDLRQHSDVLRLRSGAPVTVRFVEPGDAEALQAYFRSLSTRSRYNRFLGAVSELPPAELDRFVHVGEADRFSVVAIMTIDGAEMIVGEARYAFDADTDSVEFGLSIDDRWQGHGVGAALLRNLECRAAAFGATRLFGDTLRSNDAMIGLARKIRLRLHQLARRLEAGAIRKAHRRRAKGHSLRQLAARGAAGGHAAGMRTSSSSRGAALARRLGGWRALMVRDGAPDSAIALPGARLITMRDQTSRRR